MQRRCYVCILMHTSQSTCQDASEVATTLRCVHYIPSANEQLHDKVRPKKEGKARLYVKDTVLHVCHRPGKQLNIVSHRKQNMRKLRMVER